MFALPTVRRTLATSFLTLLGLAPMTALAQHDGGPIAQPMLGPGDFDPDRVDEVCLALGSLSVCGDWLDDGGQWTLEGDAFLATPAGDMTLAAASLTASIDPPALDGEANLEFPALSFLANAGFDGAAPRGRIALGDGDVIDTIDVNDIAIPAEAGHQYLIVDYDLGYGIGFGAFSMSGGGGAATIVIDANDPMIYVAGDVSGFMGQDLISDAAFGFSLGGALPFETDLELCNKAGKKCNPKTIHGNLLAQAQIQVGRYPVWIDGSVLVDVDASDDGDTIFDDDAGDLKLGVNGAIEVGYALGAFELLIPVAQGSVIYDGSNGEHGLLQLRGLAGAEGLFDGTPLEMFEPDTPELDLKGWFKAPDNFSLRMAYSGPFYGFDAEDMQLNLTDNGVGVSGTMRPGYGDLFSDASVQFAGSVGLDGAFLLRGTANLSVVGFEMANAECTWTNSGLRIDGVMTLPGVGEVVVTGSVDNAGNVTFDGEVDLEILGFQLAHATIAVDGLSLTIAGDLGLPSLGSVAVSGDIESDGDFRLTGTGALQPAGFELADVNVTLTPGGVEVGGRVDLAGLAEGRISGAVWTAESSQLPGGVYAECVRMSEVFAQLWASMGFDTPPMQCGAPTAGFKLTGDMRIRWNGVDIAGANVRVTNSGARISGEFDFAGVEFQVHGSVKTSGKVDLTGSVDFNWSGGIPGASASLKGSAELEMGVSSGGNAYAGASAEVKACAKVTFVNECTTIGASVHSNGDICVKFPLVGKKCLDLSGIL